MVERVRFHLDEPVNPRVAHGLRRHGIDVTTTLEAQLRTFDDATHLAFAVRGARVIVTHDADFLRMASRTTRHPGVAYCPPTSRSLGQMIDALILIWEVLGPGEMVGRVEYL